MDFQRVLDAQRSPSAGAEHAGAITVVDRDESDLALQGDGRGLGGAPGTERRRRHDADRDAESGPTGATSSPSRRSVQPLTGLRRPLGSPLMANEAVANLDHRGDRRRRSRDRRLAALEGEILRAAAGHLLTGTAGSRPKLADVSAREPLRSQGCPGRGGRSRQAGTGSWFISTPSRSTRSWPKPRPRSRPQKSWRSPTPRSPTQGRDRARQGRGRAPRARCSRKTRGPSVSCDVRKMTVRNDHSRSGGRGSQAARPPLRRSWSPRPTRRPSRLASTTRR